jgi:hypothetical protein
MMENSDGKVAANRCSRLEDFVSITLTISTNRIAGVVLSAVGRFAPVGWRFYIGPAFQLVSSYVPVTQ